MEISVQRLRTKELRHLRSWEEELEVYLEKIKTKNNMNLKDKVAYITGGTKGIGLGTAKALLDAGMRVAISGRNLEKAKEVAASLGDTTKIIGLSSDVSNFDDEQKAVEQIIQHFGQLDVVLANAGVGIFNSVDELELEEWNQMINTNLTGVFHTLKASVEELKKSEGYYITLASLAGTNFFENGAGYNASKFGVVGFT